MMVTDNNLTMVTVAQLTRQGTHSHPICTGGAVGKEQALRVKGMKQRENTPCADVVCLTMHCIYQPTLLGLLKQFGGGLEANPVETVPVTADSF